ncbi:uncharacterized mitochondrial protein AtMg00810-like [Phaseolus vulgaris]|uniref:uncharacterized mitochondrial protein AtMg00810-like n=1 Tax=Phaseolus vulgaris TaxID=3885 RepID=UPI0035CAB2E2
MIDKTLFIKKSNSEIILVQIYVDDIIIGATQDSLCEEFVPAMQESRQNIMFTVSLSVRYQANPKESQFKAGKRILKYLKGTTNVGCKLDRKCTSGTCHLLGSCLISWHSKKQACVALSTT